MFDPFMTSLSFGWFLMAAGTISALVIAIHRPARFNTVQPQMRGSSSLDPDLRPAVRWSLVTVFVLLAALGALVVQVNHDWNAFRMPHL
jgi:hypothetical protein